MNRKGKEVLPISCICSIYINTILSELIISLDSILCQDHIPNEIVIVLDGEVSNEVKKFIDYIEKEEKIFKIIKLSQNQGLGLALKYGIKYCQNNIVARFDSDDINLKGRLEKQYKIISSNKNISIIGSTIIEFDKLREDNKYILKKVPLTFAK